MASNLAGLSAELEFVDQAAVEVLERNARDAFNRRANERRDELDRVLRRVDHICSNFENYEAFSATRNPNVQYLSGLDELEKIVSDPQAKKKYLDDVTIFVVGYANDCKTRIGLIEQVSEFLLENETIFDNDLKTEAAIDFEDLNSGVEETIKSVGDLSEKIGDLHRGVVESITAHYNSKGAQKQRKKLEKALEEARKDLSDLSDKLVHLNTELQDRDLKVQQLTRQVDSRNSELHKLRAAADINKGAAASLAEVQEQLKQRNEEFDSLKAEMESLREEMDVALLRDQHETEALQGERLRLQEEAADLRQQLGEVQAQHREAQAALLELRESQNSQLEEAKLKYRRQLSALKKKHEAEMAKVQAEMRHAYTEMSREESEFDENKQTVFISDDEEPPTRTVEEDDVYEFEETIEFEDEVAWSSVPRSHCRGRFSEYRRQALDRLSVRSQQLVDTEQRSQAKTLRLKAKFNEFRQQWEQERAGLEESLLVAQQETDDAKRKAESAARKLEEVYERMQESQAAASSEGDQLQAHVAQLQVSRAQLETRVEDLEHQTRALSSQLAEAKRLKEATELRLQEALDAGAARPGSKQKSESVAEDIFDDFDDHSDSDVPFPDDRSGANSRGPGLHLADHPIVGEFMRVYRHVMRTKSRLAALLAEQNSYKEVAGHLGSVQESQLARDSKVTPQIEDLGRNLTFVSDQIFLLVENIMLQIEQQQQQQPQQQQPQEQEQQQQAEQQQQQQEELLQQQRQQQEQQLRDLEQQYKEKYDTLMQKIEDLQSKYDSVTRLLSSKEQQHQEELQQRDSALEDLQSSVASLTTEVERLRAEQQFELQNSLMFTKLDAERNTKTLKRALAGRRIAEPQYQATVDAMDRYSSVPARRLLSMSRRLLQADALLKAETAAGGDPWLLRRLVELDAARGRRYDAIMDFLREERLRLARGLVDTFEDIGESCSIFLIKPVLSLQHVDNLDSHLRTVAARNRRRAEQRDEEERRRWTASRRLSPCREETMNSEAAAAAASRLPDIGAGGVRQDTSLSELWNIGASSDIRNLPPGFDRGMLNTPRLLEMDVNKILLGQNRVSASLDASGEGLRYYVPLKRRSTETFSTQQQQQQQADAAGGQPPTPVQRATAAASVVSPLPPIKAKTHS